MWNLINLFSPFCRIQWHIRSQKTYSDTHRYFIIPFFSTGRIRFVSYAFNSHKRINVSKVEPLHVCVHRSAPVHVCWMRSLIHSAMFARVARTEDPQNVAAVHVQRASRKDIRVRAVRTHRSRHRGTSTAHACSTHSVWCCSYYAQSFRAPQSGHQLLLKTDTFNCS